MKKVLFVATVTKHINAFHIPYLKLFKEKGYEVHVASKGNEDIKYCDNHFDLPFERFPLKYNNLRTYKKLKKIINENDYEIIHCHTPVGGVLTRLAARKARKKGTRIIYTAHGFHFYKGAPLKNWIIYYPIEKICSKWTDCLITINSEDYEFAKRKFKKTKNIELVHGVGLDTSRFDIEIKDSDREKIRKDLNICNEDIVLSYVAELNDNKNQILLIDAVDKMVKENNKYKLLLIGDGPNKEKYEKEIEKRRLSDNIFLLGKRQDIPQLLSITDIYVASSIREGLGLNVIEAMYMGLPIVATNNRGHRELIDNKKNGYIVNSQESLKEKIKEIEEYKILKRTFVFINTQKVKKYTINSVIEDMKKIYTL